MLMFSDLSNQGIKITQLEMQVYLCNLKFEI